MIRRQPLMSVVRNRLPRREGNRGGEAAGGCLNTKASVRVPAYRHPSGVRRVGRGCD